MNRTTIPFNLKPGLMVVMLGLCLSTVPLNANTASLPVGHWEGELTLPTTKLEIRVDLENTDDAWHGSIDIPAQGMRGFKLTAIACTADRVSFQLPNIPGNPRFKGEFADDGQSITGHLAQSGQTFPFTIRRAIKVARAGETPDHGVPGEGFAGIWQGSLRPNGMELRLLVKLIAEGDNLTGTLSSLDQDAHDIPVTRAKQKDHALQIEIKAIHASFRGELSADGSEVVGKWRQGSDSMPLTLMRLQNSPDLSRPQDPAKPYPYLEQEVLIENREAGVTLAGTLTSPAAPGPHPAVVLISGSGPQDRDEAIMGHRPFLVLADRLTRAGITVLRYDDRGFQKSTGDFQRATTRDFVSDALAAHAFLMARPDVDPARIGLIGHSEGGLVAPMAAVSSNDVAFIVLLAGVGVPMPDLLARQSQDLMRLAGAGEDVCQLQAKIQSQVFETVLTADGSPDLASRVRAVLEEASQTLAPNQRGQLGFGPNQIEHQVQQAISPWFQEILTIDPRPILQQVQCPVLALNGSKDMQVAAAENLSAIESALQAGANSHTTIRELPGLNHLFQEAATGSPSEYGEIEETFNEDALAVIVSWIRNVTALN